MLSIVVPTYKEAGNIGSLVERVHEELTAARLDYEMLVVDDNSPDNIREVIAGLESRYPVRLLQPTGRARDLSRSVIDGMVAANHDRILVMDADHSHPPSAIPGMFAKLKEQPGAFVVGSRYVEDGSFDRRWSLWRFLNSHVATMITRPLVKCRDPMSGFFAFDRARIEDVEKLNPIGYKIGLELMVRGNFDSVIEVPIQFLDREIGESKLNLDQQIKFLRHLRRLYTVRFGGIGEFLSYGLVGASGFIVDLTFYYLFQLLGIPHQLARALSFWPAVTWNWRLNRIATFGERKRRPGARQWVEFVLASLFGFSINWGTYVVLTSQFELFDQYRLVAMVIGIGVASMFNFIMSTLYVYNEKRQ